MGGRQVPRQEKGQAICLTLIGIMLSKVPGTSVVNGKQIPDDLSGLQFAGRHFARLVVALQFEADLLAFDEFAYLRARQPRCGRTHRRRHCQAG